jgi:hypothetical protein
VQTYAALTSAGTAALRRARTAFLHALRGTLPAEDLAGLTGLTGRTTRLLAELTPGGGDHPTRSHA